MLGRGDIDGARLRTPRSELARLGGVREDHRAEIAGRIMEAMLEVCGERGYRRASVQNVLDRCGASRRQFYSHFRSKSDCYAAAYEIEIERRYAALVGARARKDLGPGGRHRSPGNGRAPGDAARLARGLLIEVHVAGGRAMGKRAEILARLAEALDGAREDPGVRHSPPPLTSAFMLGAIEASSPAPCCAPRRRSSAPACGSWPRWCSRPTSVAMRPSPSWSYCSQPERGLVGGWAQPARC